jgi:hypothetical protein
MLADLTPSASKRFPAIANRLSEKVRVAPKGRRSKQGPNIHKAAALFARCPCAWLSKHARDGCSSPYLSMQVIALWLVLPPGFVALLKWPSVVYALDILGWDIFFPLSILFAAPVFRGRGVCHAIRITMIASALCAFAGLLGAALGNMSLRNIGIVGCLSVFLVVDALLLTLFLRAKTGPALATLDEFR